ncbi:hypothetical protein P9112_001059 [Eukaryota sp. TZLM1-RC]
MTFRQCEFELKPKGNIRVIDEKRPSMIEDVYSLREWDDLDLELAKRLRKTSWKAVCSFLCTLLSFVAAMSVGLYFDGNYSMIDVQDEWIFITLICFFAVLGVVFFVLSIILQNKASKQAAVDTLEWIRTTINPSVQDRGLFFKLDVGKQKTYLVIQLAYEEPLVLPSHSTSSTDWSPAAPPIYTGSEDAPDILIS